MIGTWLTETLRLRYPIIQAGMGPFETADLAITVWKASVRGGGERELKEVRR